MLVRLDKPTARPAIAAALLSVLEYACATPDDNRPLATVFRGALLVRSGVGGDGVTGLPRQSTVF